MTNKETKWNITPVGRSNWFIYRHIRKDSNSPFYIGIGKDPKRPYSIKYRNKAWLGVIAKTEYEVEVLLKDLTKTQAIGKEIEFIALYGRKDINTGCLYNMTDGGEGVNNMVYTKERNAKIAKSLTGKKHSQEAKIKQTFNQKHRLQVTIEGVEYLSLRQAGLALGIHKNTVKSRYL